MLLEKLRQIALGGKHNFREIDNQRYLKGLYLAILSIAYLVPINLRQQKSKANGEGEIHRYLWFDLQSKFMLKVKRTNDDLPKSNHPVIVITYS